MMQHLLPAWACRACLLLPFHTSTGLTREGLVAAVLLLTALKQGVAG
jgi:hypothetical protein